MNSESTEIVKRLLNTTRKIVVVGHKNPDGDAIGSCLGLYLYLKELGHDTVVIMPNDFPNFLKWMPGCDSIIIHEKEVELSKTLISNAEIIFTLDFNSLKRIGELQELLEKSLAKFIMIDHHQAPDDYALVTYSDTTMSSTAEMVYHFIQALDDLKMLNPQIATNLYAGIMTDTGSFRFSSTSATTHRVVARLIEVGANGALIYQNIYDTYSLDRMKLLGVSLNNLRILTEYNTAYITLSQKELDDNNFKKGDTEGFVNCALTIEGIIFALIFIENKQESIVKVSLRSKGNFSVNDFARNHYEGGGHINAAGGKSSKSLTNTISEFITILRPYKNALSNHVT